MSMALLLVAGMLAANPAPPDSYVLRVYNAMHRCAADIPAMQAPAEEAARRLVAGGKFWAAGQASWVSELTGRAGGFMMLKPLTAKPGDGDVVLYAPTSDPAPDFGSAYVVAFGGVGGWTLNPPPAVHAAAHFDNHAAECSISPTLANAIPGWYFTGELIAALTRLGKMPVIYESIGAYGGNARMVQYKYGEIAWHDQCPPPVAHGVISNRYLDTISGMLLRIDAEQHYNMVKAGKWARKAQKAGGTLYMYSMGHLFPDEVEKTDIGNVFKSAVWNAGFRTSPPPEDIYESGDFAVHVGYQHPPMLLLERITKAGGRAAYLSVLPDRDYAGNPSVIYIDPMWDWADSCVDLEGYDVPLLASSGIVNGAIAWEIYRLSIK